MLGEDEQAVTENMLARIRTVLIARKESHLSLQGFRLEQEYRRKSESSVSCRKIVANHPESWVIGAIGGVAEWSIAAVLKTVEPRGSGGSNPSPSATIPSPAPI